MKWNEENVEKEMEKFFRQRVRGKMIFFSVPKITVKCEKDKVSVIASARKRKMSLQVRTGKNSACAGKIYQKEKENLWKVNINRDWNHMYFILERPEFYEEDYQMRMLQENKIEGLLQVSGQG